MNAAEASDAELAHVSVVVPARDAAALLPACLASIEAQTYRGPLDVTVAVGGGRDATQALLEASSLRVPLQIVDNPAATTPAGLNAAIAASRGRIVARVDAQSRLPPDYIERAVATLARTGAANVGGVQRPVGPGTGSLADVIAAAMSSPFGAGPAAFRRRRHGGPADTVYLGVFDREALEQAGGFDERFERNQDYELNWRLRAAGRTVWLDPTLVVDYVPRSGYLGLATQYFEYGAWKRRVLLRHPRSLRARQLAAPALVAGLAASAVELLRGRWRGAALPAGYAAACVVAATRLADRDRRNRCDTVRAAAAFAVMHISWGAGFLTGRARRAQPESGAQDSM